MIERIAIWWRFYKLRAKVYSWMWHRRQYNEWRDRFYVGSEQDKQKSTHYLMKHDGAMAELVSELAFGEYISKNTWIPLGDGREFRYVPKNNAHHKLEVRDAQPVSTE